MGLEPTTTRSTIWCSTIELQAPQNKTSSSAAYFPVGGVSHLDPQLKCKTLREISRRAYEVGGFLGYLGAIARSNCADR